MDQKTPFANWNSRIRLGNAAVASGFCLFLVTFAVMAQEDRAKATQATVRAVLDDQVAAWNERDLGRFMKGYWDDDRLTFFSGNDKTAGWKATLERYRKRYQADGKEMGKLSFADLSIEFLGDDHALVRGRFRLELKTESPTGIFTLIMRKTSQGWKIVHDHTSS